MKAKIKKLAKRLRNRNSITFKTDLPSPTDTNKTYSFVVLNDEIFVKDLKYVNQRIIMYTTLNLKKARRFIADSKESHKAIQYARLKGYKAKEMEVLYSNEKEIQLAEHIANIN